MPNIGRTRKLGASVKGKSLSVRIHDDVRDWLEKKPDKSTWTREAIIAYAWSEVGGRKAILDSLARDPQVWAEIGETHRLPEELVDAIVEANKSQKIPGG